MTDKTDRPKSFWQTVPGLLTGLAALLTAIGALIAALDDSPVLGKKTESTPTTSSAPNPVAATERDPTAITMDPGNGTSGDRSPIVNGTDGNVTITIGD